MSKLFISQLKHEAKMHKLSGANGLSQLFNSAADKIAELEKERDNLTDDLIEAQNQAREAENKFEDIESVFCDEDGYPLIEPFNGEELADWITRRDLEQQLKILKQYANTCGVLRKEPSTRDLHELIMELESQAKALKEQGQ